MQFRFLEYRNSVDGQPQFQCRCFEDGIRVRYVPDDWSTTKVTHRGLWEGTPDRQLTPQGVEPCTVTVMVTAEIPEPVIETAFPRASELFVGQFRQERHPSESKMQWKRRHLAGNGRTVVHVVDERSALQACDNTTFWQYRLACNLSMDPDFEAWTVELVKEIAVQSEVSDRGKRNKFARQMRAQGRIADLLAEQAENQKFRKELEARRAGGGNNKQGKKKDKSLARAS